jgi:hypothetical protein
MKPRKKNKADNLGLGFLIGVLFPLLIFFVVYQANDKSGSFLDYLSGLWHLQALIKLGSLCVFANVAVFWIFIKLKYEKTARGILGATILYAFVVLFSRAI